MKTYTIYKVVRQNKAACNSGRSGNNEMNMTRFMPFSLLLTVLICFLLSIALTSNLQAQVGTVSSYQKISDSTGNFSGNLFNSDYFGNGVCNLGDVDGDGVGDIAVGAPDQDDGGPDRGVVYILFLNVNGTVKSHQKISDTQGNFTGTLQNTDMFGYSVERIADLDGDGVDELAVGALMDNDGYLDAGAVWILFLNTNGTVKSHQKISQTNGGLIGPLGSGFSLGCSIASLGDLDGDGNSDIAIGTENDNDGGTSRGCVWILFLNANGTVKSEQKISDTKGNFTGTLDNLDHFGMSIDNLGDMDNDGIIDIVVGAEKDDDGGQNRGAAWILFMNANGTVKSHQKISDTEGGFTGTLSNMDNFGRGVAGMGDINGDGYMDLAVSAYQDNDGGTTVGAVWILFLNPNGTVNYYQKISKTQGNFSGVLNNGDNFGASISCLNDFNGDGINDLISGSIGDDDMGPDRGAAWLLFLDGPPEQVSAQTGSWNTPSTWMCNCIPSDTELVTISNGSTITLDGDIIAKDIIIENGAILDAGVANDYNITLKGNWKNSGTFNQKKGTVNFEASVAQEIEGATTFYSLTINNPNGVSIASGTQSIKGTITLSKGIFNLFGNSLVIISDADETARIAGTGTGSIDGNITAQQYVDGGPGYRFISSPVTGATFEDLDDDFTTWGITGSDYPNYGWESIYYYNETLAGENDTGWIAPSNMNEIMIAGKGYIAYIDAPDIPTTIDIIGPANLSIYQPTITFNSSGAGIGHDGWNLVGNPYSSPIDWDASNGWTKGNLDNAVYVWRSVDEVYASYVNGIGTNGGSNILASTQAYWVKANNTNPEITMTRDIVVASDTSFIRENNTIADALKLRIDGNGYIDETVLYFESEATEIFDSKLDAYKLFSDNDLIPMIFTGQDNMQLSINALPKLNKEIRVPLHFEIATAGTYTIDAEELGIFQPGVCIYLEDDLTGSSIDLKSGNSYTFFTDTVKSSDPPRLFVHFSAPVSVNATDVSCAGKNDGIAMITMQSLSEWECELYDENGYKVYSSEKVFGSEIIAGLPHGKYTVNIIGGTFCSGVETFTIYEPYELEAFTNRTDASCFGESNAMINLEVTGGVQPYSFHWHNGSTSKDLLNIPAGLYTFQIIDANGCENIETITVEQPDEIIAEFSRSGDIIYIKQGGLATFVNYSEGAVYYEWDFGDGSPISTLIEPTHTYIAEGEYSVTMIAYNGQCTDTSVMKVSVLAEPTENIEEATLIFPNPVSAGNVQVIIPGYGYEEISIEIYNPLGELIYSEDLQKVNGEFTTTIKTNGVLSDGLYIMAGTNNGNTLFKRKLIITE